MTLNFVWLVFLEELATSEEVNKLREDFERLSLELETVRQERDHLQQEFNLKMEELRNTKEQIEINSAQQQLVSLTCISKQQF